jgi:hypothetical protein
MVVTPGAVDPNCEMQQSAQRLSSGYGRYHWKRETLLLSFHESANLIVTKTRCGQGPRPGSRCGLYLDATSNCELNGQVYVDLCIRKDRFR